MGTTDVDNDPFSLNGITIDGKYRVASVVGDGGFGLVYRGVHKGFGELIAIKCLKLPQELLSEKERDAFLERLREEGRLLHRLSRATPGIVQALDVGAVVSPSGAWVPYLVLEWLEGETLGQWFRRRLSDGEGGLSLTEAVELMEPAARALAVAHQQKIAHRDVKPANLFVTDVAGTQTLKVLDFGIAKVLSDQGTLTAQMEATGLAPAAFTPRYGAPEQFNKKRGASGPWTDVFALALIMVELMSAERALDGDDPTQLYIAASDPQARPTPRAHGISVPDEVEAVFAKALEVEARDRYPDAGTFWDALVAAVQDSAASSTATSSDRRATGSRDDMVVSPTVPVESLRKGTAKDSKSAPEDNNATDPQNPAEAASSFPSPPTSAVRKPMAAEDPMAETPPHRRSQPSQGEVAEQITAASGPKKPRPAPEDSKKKAGPPWLLLSLLVLLGGAGFAYVTFFSAGRPTPRSTPSAVPSDTTPPAPTDRVAPLAYPSSTAPILPSASASSEPGPGFEPPPDMVRIEAGTLAMGASGVRTTVSTPFLLDIYEVSVRAYRECVAAGACGAADAVVPTADDIQAADADDGTGGNNGSSASSQAYAEAWARRCNEPRGALDHPINCVPFAQAEAFCQWKGRRLPTEAEWELAARGDGRTYPWGSRAPSCESVCFDRNDSCLVPGELVASCALGTHPGDRTTDGIYDLGGNVAEWVADRFTVPLPGGTDPRVTEGADQVIKGGSFMQAADYARATARRPRSGDAAHVEVGFRCAMSIPEEPAPDN